VCWFRLLQLLGGVGPVTARHLLDHPLADVENPDPAWRRWHQGPRTARQHSHHGSVARAVRGRAGARPTTLELRPGRATPPR
jgi:hypothetical protein